MKYGYTVQYIEEMYAHYANLLYSAPHAPADHYIYWLKMQDYYLRQHEAYYNFAWIASQLPLQQINPKS